MRRGYVYILSNRRRTTFYIGVTGNLRQRLLQHQAGEGNGFSKKYQLKYLIYYEIFPSLLEAITREKQLKNWRRDWKINLVKSVNQNLNDLSAELP